MVARRYVRAFPALILFIPVAIMTSAAQGNLHPNPEAETHSGWHETMTLSSPKDALPQLVPSVLEPTPRSKLLVIGFMGGNVHAANIVHRESSVIASLRERFPGAVDAQLYANRDGAMALKAVIAHLDGDRDGRLTTVEKASARIIVFGHSWGASQTVTLADELNRLGVPVLLTIQVDSVQKIAQNDGIIPPNVREAVNFYQTEGMLRGRRVIAAADPTRTKILGNHESRYRENPISVAGYPWYARAFMRQHIQIESDPQVWDQIEGLIEARIR
jgi:pimeloyl-ACP methyl ester carboxylesterase